MADSPTFAPQLPAGAANDRKRNTAPQRSSTITAASILYIVQGLGTLISFVPIIAFAAQNRTFPVLFGIPLMGSTFSERLGVDFMVRAGIVFQIVNALEIVAAYWLWKSDKRGGRLGLVLLPIGLPFWVLFELPIPLIIGPLRAIALVAGWKNLR
jgi:hypothetical protein